MSRWELTFRPEGDGPPVAARVKRLLKLALRSCGLRCIDAQRVPDGSGSQAEAREGKKQASDGKERES